MYVHFLTWYHTKQQKSPQNAWNSSWVVPTYFYFFHIYRNYIRKLVPLQTICHCSVLTVKVKLLIWRLSDLEILYYCIFSSKYNLDSSCSCREMLLSCISTFLLSPHTVFIWNTDNKYYIENISYSIEQGSEKRTLCLM